MKPGSACRPVPGFNVKVLDENGVEIKVEHKHSLIINRTINSAEFA
jgi:acyl-coenzyme A synthetase/AMP-(fatty) acid ligase